MHARITKASDTGTHSRESLEQNQIHSYRLSLSSFLNRATSDEMYRSLAVLLPNRRRTEGQEKKCLNLTRNRVERQLQVVIP